MTRPSRTGGRTSEAKARNASLAKGRKATKTKRRIAPAAPRVKRRSVTGPGKDLKDAREQQAATAEILKVIASWPGDVQPVLEAVAERAMGLLDAWSVLVTRFDGELLRFGAARGALPDTEQFLRNHYPMRPEAAVFAGRCILERSTINISDAQLDPSPQNRDRARLRGFRAALSVPMLRDGQPIGVITVSRREAGAFTANEVELLQTFADQAVIAIENTRLFNETREALERQTATAEILKVIASSPSDVQPVFEAVVNRAARLFDPCSATITTLKEGKLYWNASAQIIPSFDHEAARAVYPIPFDPLHSPSSRAVLERRIIAIPDTHALDTPEATRRISAAGGFRSITFVPLIHENRGIGTIILTHPQTGFKFSDKELAQLQTFADQAVIAIENARLFNEVRHRTEDLSESLQQQTATADVLKVISRSTFDLQTVLNTLLESAARLCGADLANIWRPAGGAAFHMAASFGIAGKDHEWLENKKYLERLGLEPGRGSIVGRALLEVGPVQVQDIQDDPEYELSELVRIGDYRTMLGVPLLREGFPVGVFVLTRCRVELFTDKQIELVSSFADQAVIAIENVRLFNETQEALERQTATADILKVIASSPNHVQPVFEAIAERSNRLVNGLSTAVYRLVDGMVHLMAFTPVSPVADAALQASFPAQLSQFSMAAVGKGETYNIVDAEVEFATRPSGLELARLRGWRSLLGVPLLREGKPIGLITVTRVEPGRFDDHHIQLLQTFADQAVIAIGNVRLFDEVQARTQELSESLEQQTATSEVLSVISSSAGDLAPVFDAMLGKAMQLCGADFGVLNTYDGARFHTAATRGLPPPYDRYRRSQPLVYGPDTAPARLLGGEPFVEIPDLQESAAYRNGDPNRRALVDLGGARTILAVPLLKDDQVVGNVMIFRQVPARFSVKQISLLKQFAAQAVIAIENTRLLTELRQRTNDLTESLEDLRTAQDRLVQTEKLASLGQLTAGIAHEIKNPLNFVNNFSALSGELVEEMRDALSDINLDKNKRDELDEIAQMLKDNLEKVVQHGKRADTIVKNMLLHSREGSGEHRPADINLVLDESLNLAYHGARAEKPGFNITLQRDFDADAGTVEVFPQEITRAFLNLISNSFYAATRRKTENNEPGFEPTLWATTKSLGSSVEIRVRDNGTGISAEVQEKMFNPFFTTKPAGEGTGLGLSMTHDIIVKQHRGRIDVTTEPGQFTEFTIVLPRKSNFSGNDRGET